jgi:hypothetical protein
MHTFTYSSWVLLQQLLAFLVPLLRPLTQVSHVMHDTYVGTSKFKVQQSPNFAFPSMKRPRGFYLQNPLGIHKPLRTLADIPIATVGTFVDDSLIDARCVILVAEEWFHGYRFRIDSALSIEVEVSIGNGNEDLSSIKPHFHIPRVMAMGHGYVEMDSCLAFNLANNNAVESALRTPKLRDCAPHDMHGGCRHNNKDSTLSPQSGFARFSLTRHAKPCSFPCMEKVPTASLNGRIG